MKTLFNPIPCSLALSYAPGGHNLLPGAGVTPPVLLPRILQLFQFQGGSCVMDLIKFVSKIRGAAHLCSLSCSNCTPVVIRH